jgi:ubiquinone/menaquinone biosynthesis C-methylase UbiE
MRRFMDFLEIGPDTRILDVGGTPENWLLLDARPRVTLLNMPRASEPVPPGFLWVSADGSRLPFRDREFDVAFSNSVIEHVGSPERQAMFAREVQRVAKHYWVQTPNRGAPVEAHLLMPFVHWMPREWQQPIVRRWTLWEMIERPSPDRRQFYIDHYLNDIRLLNARDMEALFPEATILRERVLGITKSLVAVK